MGSGFLEPVYQECLALEMAERGIPFAAQHTLPLVYKGIPLRQLYVADFICFEKIILEIKAVGRITQEHRARTLNYLAATGLRLGMIVNFGSNLRLETERLITNNRE